MRRQRTMRAPATQLAAIALVAAAAPLSAQTVASAAVDKDRLMADLRALAHDSMAGRRAGTAGGVRAIRYIEHAMDDAGLTRFGGSYSRPFEFNGGRGGQAVQAANVVGYLRGRVEPERVIVLTAHFDHLGERNGQIYNGADDNASGVAAMLAIARHFAEDAPRHTIVFAALDAEEAGLRGARAFVDQPPVPFERIAIAVNLDMVSRNAEDELWVAGTHHTPALRPFIERMADSARVRLRIGHDRPGVQAQDDWTNASDHGPFHAKGIPFLYFGVEDHADYHRESDEADRVNADFFVRSVQTIAEIVRALDTQLTAVLPARAR
ncbi:MAG: M20/M25/M40 family metallo-hydrolase [Longimicrobiales bacterium]